MSHRLFCNGIQTSKHIAAGLLLGLGAPMLAGAGSPSAQFTEVVGKVSVGSLVTRGETPAAVGQRFTSDEFAKTARQSRAEMSCDNGALVRIGPNSVFRFDLTRGDYRLDQGRGLFVFPKGQGERRVYGGVAVAAILGTTVYIDAAPGRIRYYCLEGKCRVGSHVLYCGQLLDARGSSGIYAVPKRGFDVPTFLKSNDLITAFRRPLPSRALIEREMRIH